ncbi:phosphate ABC transporter permease subunit PstC [Simiduia curdlanivorans]|uniref:Phosphate transport system permease protein n=1 Tax=Simiduia curdlanivorans TaxID=1492769 RepID=A0ABV8UZW1_9GAMM|nr:phosphate ABC transporter permease subunit PstC [Simiduia curdlanivorans]MDN3637960.1 phosphate ABC transporter permease subunit PstC [Simiduia curdlanivorans]
MQPLTLATILLALFAFAFVLGRGRSVLQSQAIGGTSRLASLPFYYGMLTALWCALPCLIVLGLWQLLDGQIIQWLVIDRLSDTQQNLSGSDVGLLLNTITNLSQGHLSADGQSAEMLSAAESLKSILRINQLALTGTLLSIAILGLLFGWSRVSPSLRARQKVEAAFSFALLLCSCLAIFTTIGIVLSVLFESLQFFKSISPVEFLFGTQWSPQMAMREDQVGSSGAFGSVPLFAGTMLISLIAMVVAVPVGLMAAIYLAEYANKSVRLVVKPMLEILAGIPTVVYGFFAALTVAPMVRDAGFSLGFSASSESALAAGLVMGVMIIPFISSLADDVITAVPQSLRDGSLALGATHSETIKKVVLPAALPGVVGGILLAVSRAIGETMIVVMAAGLAAKLTANPLESVTTVTVQIVTLLVGDQEFDSPKTLAAFALGLMLFVTTLALNFVALHVVKKYREQYE